MKLKPLPISRAKTAWGLLGDVKRAILAEPKRVDMSCYVDRQDPENGGPACGTVGCFAGWVSILGRKSPGTHPKNSMALTQAYNLLGRDLVYTFGPMGEEYFNGGSGDACGTTDPGTKRHAKAVVNRINRFMRVNAKALKAKRIR